jgi:hypothetical protein
MTFSVAVPACSAAGAYSAAMFFRAFPHIGKFLKILEYT